MRSASMMYLSGQLQSSSARSDVKIPVGRCETSLPRALTADVVWVLNTASRVPLDHCCSPEKELHMCMQAAAKPSKPAEKDDAAPKDRNGDDNNGPSRGSQPAAPAGGATPGTAAASGSTQGNRGGSAGPSNAASLGDRRQSTDRRRTAGEHWRLTWHFSSRCGDLNWVIIAFLS